MKKDETNWQKQKRVILIVPNCKWYFFCISFCTKYNNWCGSNNLSFKFFFIFVMFCSELCNNWNFCIWNYINVYSIVLKLNFEELWIFAQYLFYCTYALLYTYKMYAQLLYYFFNVLRAISNTMKLRRNIQKRRQVRYLEHLFL